MDPAIFKVLHIIGAILLFTGIGGLMGCGENRPHINKIVSIFNGLGLLILLIAGMGMQGMGHLGWPLWLILKLVIWVVMAVIFTMTKKDKIGMKNGVLILVGLGCVVAWLCIMKPFTGA